MLKTIQFGCAAQYFKILKQCLTKLDCLIYEMLYTKYKNPSLNI